MAKVRCIEEGGGFDGIQKREDLNIQEGVIEGARGEELH